MTRGLTLTLSRRRRLLVSRSNHCHSHSTPLHSNQPTNPTHPATMSVYSEASIKLIKDLKRCKDSKLLPLPAYRDDLVREVKVSGGVMLPAVMVACPTLCQQQHLTRLTSGSMKCPR
jgi:hypothetical protein